MFHAFEADELSEHAEEPIYLGRLCTKKFCHIQEVFASVKTYFNWKRPGNSDDEHERVKTFLNIELVSN